MYKVSRSASHKMHQGRRVEEMSCTACSQEIKDPQKEIEREKEG